MLSHLLLYFNTEHKISYCEESFKILTLKYDFVVITIKMYYQCLRRYILSEVLFYCRVASG